MKLKDRSERDQRNAGVVRQKAAEKCADGQHFVPTGTFASPVSQTEQELAAGIRDDYASHAVMEREPFHAMLEVEVENERGLQSALWYVNTKTTVNAAFTSDGKRFGVLSWTHPGAQIALSRRWAKLSGVVRAVPPSQRKADSSGPVHERLAGAERRL